MSFIRHSEKYCTFEEYVPAPYFRKTFWCDASVKEAKLEICGLGFYEVHINGKNITKGFLAPYRSNHNDYIYYDKYDLTQSLQSGKNVIACILGNGMQNPFGAFIWDFHKAPWRGAPQLDFKITIIYADGETQVVSSDQETKTTYSPILFDDLHYGEYYDARLEILDWDKLNFDDSTWKNAELAPVPLGERKFCEAEPIVATGDIKPISITKCDAGYIYDFGENNTGLCRITIVGETGQKVVLKYFETLVNGKPYYENIRFEGTDRFQEDEYICSGHGVEEHMARFTYHGFRYVYVQGITEEQATKDLLTYVTICSDIKTIGKFECDNEILNKIQEATVRSDISNFHYFPTDCPQREKNGWTADAALSAEQMLLNIAPEKSYKEWMRNIYKAINFKGQLPGIIPTTGWGYEWGNGPAWDSVLVNIPYFTYIYRGDKDILRELSIPLMRYLTYLYTRLNEDNLVEYGLVDWCQPNRKNEGDATTPLVVTDSIVTYDIARKAAFIYGQLGFEEQENYANALAEKVKGAIREKLIDFNSCNVYGDTQTGLAMAIFYDIFNYPERKKALNNLVEMIRANNCLMDVGVQGARVIFRVLAENGYVDLAYKMITHKEHPSYANIILRGATTLWESFWKEEGRILSMNHHFWGDVSAWFYVYLAGMRINPNGDNPNEVHIIPRFPKDLNHVKASHQLPAGELVVEWNRIDKNHIEVHLDVPNGVFGKVKMKDGWCFSVGKYTKDLCSGKYIVEGGNDE